MTEKLKIVINGCSHTKATIPDNIHGKPWPIIMGEDNNWDVRNLATNGKANTEIIEELLRYIAHFPETEYVVCQLTEWKRINVYKREDSNKWIPGKFGSQAPFYEKIPAGNNELDLTVYRHTGTVDENKTPIGDSELLYERITTGSLVNALYQVCKTNGIGLTIVNMHAIGHTKFDPVWRGINKNCFLIKNKRFGLYNHLLWSYSTPDTFHFEHAAHYEIAYRVANHIKYKERLEVNEEDYDATYNIFEHRVAVYD